MRSSRWRDRSRADLDAFVLVGNAFNNPSQLERFKEPPSLAESDLLFIASDSILIVHSYKNLVGCFTEFGKHLPLNISSYYRERAVARILKTRRTTVASRSFPPRETF